MDKLVNLQKHYRAVYESNEYNLAGVSEKDIHVMSDFFLDNFTKYKVSEFDDRCFKLTAIYKDVVFMSLIDIDEYMSLINEDEL